MIKRIYYIAIVSLFLLGACATQNNLKHNNGNSFRTVPEELASVDWSSTPADVVNNPKNMNPLSGSALSETIYQTKSEGK